MIDTKKKSLKTSNLIAQKASVAACFRASCSGRFAQYWTNVKKIVVIETLNMGK